MTYNIVASRIFRITCTYRNSKYMSQYQVRTACFSNGERFPILISGATGVPLFEPTIYAASELRGKNSASNTMAQAMRSVMLLYIVLERRGIDLNQRMAGGRFLDATDIEDIVSVCKTTMPSILESEDQISSRPRKVLSLEKARMALSRTKQGTDVEPATTAIRLNYIRDYLRWLANSRLLRLTSSKDRSNLMDMARIVDESIKNKTPRKSGRNQMNQRVGLSRAAQECLTDIMSGNSTENPWIGDHAKARNVLIIRLLLHTGIRRGELLGLRIEDINAQQNEILVCRRPDDVTDPRLNEPNTKTRDRLIPINSELAHEIRGYVAMRREFKGARRHGFLLVANGTGKPLSVSAFNRIFQALQPVSPLLQYLTPHVLRHTFNDNLSDALDNANVSPEQEIQIRNRLNGWSERSQMAAVYTKRHTQKKAADAILAMQRQLTVKVANE